MNNSISSHTIISYSNTYKLTISQILISKIDPSHVINPSEVEIQADMSYEEEPMRILAREVKELRNKRVPLVKVLWLKHGIDRNR